MRRRALAWPVLAALAAGSARAAEVNIDNFTFSPARVTIQAGERVTWTNADDIPHTVTDGGAQPPAWTSGALDTGARFARAFPSPGTYTYFCSLHPHMTGIVTVTR